VSLIGLDSPIKLSYSGNQWATACYSEGGHRMPDLTIVVRDNDLPMLDQLAERDWRSREQEVSALLEAALHQARARANAPERSPRQARRATRTNGAVRVEA
jgi:hypothetical protein